MAYYRVSTAKQGSSGLGLDAQRAAVRIFTKCETCIIAEFTEIETGTSKRERVEIRKALEFAKRKGATLVIAKLDRLARSVSFISSLMDSGVDFVACDLPAATPLTIHIFAAIAEHEAKLISDRTRAALQAKREREDWEPGTPENLTDKARRKAWKANSAKARSNDNNRRAADAIKDKRAAGKTWQQIADELNAAGYKTARGKEFHAMQAKRLFDRAAA